MKLYVVIRVCALHPEAEIGPPVGVYYTPNHAYDSVKRWKREHSWDKNKYKIVPMEIYGKCGFKSDPQKPVWMIIRICDAFGTNKCGTCAGLYYSEECAVEGLEVWQSEHPWDMDDFYIKEFQVLGHPDTRKKTRHNRYWKKMGQLL